MINVISKFAASHRLASVFFNSINYSNLIEPFFPTWAFPCLVPLAEESSQVRWPSTILAYFIRSKYFRHVRLNIWSDMFRLSSCKTRFSINISSICRVHIHTVQRCLDEENVRTYFSLGLVVMKTSVIMTDVELSTHRTFQWIVGHLTDDRR